MDDERPDRPLSDVHQEDTDRGAISSPAAHRPKDTEGRGLWNRAKGVVRRKAQASSSTGARIGHPPCPVLERVAVHPAAVFAADNPRRDNNRATGGSCAA